ncbi:right-handed parallel beta-helix repeat-containing protein [Streptomyces sp. M19]
MLRGKDGKGGLFGKGGTNDVRDLAIAGDVPYRDDAAFDAGIEGDFGTGSTIQNVWIEHTKVGLWIDGPTQGLQVAGVRVRDTFADGVNLHQGTTGTEVSDSSIRNTGDDALAMFSEEQAVTGSSFRDNTVQVPLLANGAAIYGGEDNTVADNLVSDTVTGSAGIAISSRFAPSLRRHHHRLRQHPAPYGRVRAQLVRRTRRDLGLRRRLRHHRARGDHRQRGGGLHLQRAADLGPADRRGPHRRRPRDRHGRCVRHRDQRRGWRDLLRHHRRGRRRRGLKVAGGFTVTRGEGNSGW